MQVQNRINNQQWPRCRTVALSDDVLHCSLALDRRYVLTEAYKYDLHIRFANAKTDHDLIQFVLAWGPLDLSDGQMVSSDASFSLSDFRTFQRWLKAVLDLLAAFKSADGERIALREFIEADYEQERNSPASLDEPISWMMLKQEFAITGAVVAWINGAAIGEVRAATDLLLPLVVVRPVSGDFLFRRRRNRGEVEARWAIDNLREALFWMVWYDEFTKHPINCCQECRKVFRSDTAHARKYCSRECAHRATGRNWQRRRRASLRTSKRNQRSEEK